MRNKRKIPDTATALAAFETAAMQECEATEMGDYKTGNKCYEIIKGVIKYLDENHERSELVSFTKHPSVGVRMAAASYLLSSEEVIATEILEEIARRADIHSLTAKTTLSEWKKGNLKL